MKTVWVLLGVLLSISITQAQPDAGPGMAKVDAPPNRLEDQIRATRRTAFAELNHPAGKLDLSSPEATVRSFVWAFTNADFKTARQCILDAQPYEKLVEIEKVFHNLFEKQPQNILVSDFRSVAKREQAIVTMRVTFIADMAQDTAPSTLLADSSERFYLQNTEGNWLIMADPRAEDDPTFRPFQRDVTGFGISIDTLVRLTGLFIHPETVMQKKPLSDCQSNLKQIGLGIFQFTQDFDDKFPSHDNWKKQVLPYTHTEAFFKCPAAPQNESSYSYNIELEDRSMDGVATQAQTILLYEGKDRKFEFRHQIGEEKLTNILFANGYVKSFNEKALEAALKDESVRWTP